MASVVQKAAMFENPSLHKSTIATNKNVTFGASGQSHSSRSRERKLRQKGLERRSSGQVSSSHSVGNGGGQVLVSTERRQSRTVSTGRSQAGGAQSSTASGAAINQAYTMKAGAGGGAEKKKIVVKRKSSKNRAIIHSVHSSVSHEVNIDESDSAGEMSRLDMVGSMNSQVETIRNETMRLGTDLTESNKERYNQITELMNSLRIALERKDTMENSYKTQINKLVSTLKLVSEEKTEIEEEICDLLERNAQLNDIIIKLKLRLEMKDEDTDDDELLFKQLDKINWDLKKQIELLQGKLQQREEFIEILKQKKNEITPEVQELREKIVVVTGQLAFAQKVDAEVVLAANVKIDHFEDCYLIGYHDDNDPDTLLANTKRAVVELRLMKTLIKCADKDCVKFTLKEHRAVKRPEKFKFGVHLFGPAEEVFQFNLCDGTGERIETQRIETQFEFSMGDMPCGKYRVSLTNKSINGEHSPYSEFLIKQSPKEYITFDCPKPVIEKPVIKALPFQQFEFQEAHQTIRRSVGNLRIPVIRNEKGGRLTYSWSTENIYKTGFHNEVGIQGFNDGSFESIISIYMDQEHKEESKTEYWINLVVQQPDISSLGPRMKIKITIINDIELTIIGFSRTGHMGNYDCQTTPTAKFSINRSTTKNSLNVQWKTSFNRYIDQAELRSKCHCLSAPCIDIGFRLDKYYWNQQTGSVRFEDGSDRAIIDVKIPCNSDLCFTKEDVVLELREPRSKGVELDQDRSKCNFTVLFEPHEEKPE